MGEDEHIRQLINEIAKENRPNPVETQQTLQNILGILANQQAIKGERVAGDDN